jgi:hypothetical protein
VMTTDDRRVSVGGEGCGGEVGATRRFVSWLWAEIQPRKRGCGGSPWSRGVEKIIVMGADVCVLASFFLLRSPLALLCDDIQKHWPLLSK